MIPLVDARNFSYAPRMVSADKKNDIYREHLQIMADTAGLSLSALAKSAGLDPKTVTRFVNKPDVNHTITMVSLDKLAERVGYLSYYDFRKSLEDKATSQSSEIYLHGHITNMSGQRLGWICPSCGTPYAPHVESCKPCATTNLPSTPPIKKQKEKLP